MWMLPLIVAIVGAVLFMAVGILAFIFVDVMEHSVFIEAQQQRADSSLGLTCVTKSAHHAIRRANALELLHRKTFPRRVGQVASLRHNSIE